MRFSRTIGIISILIAVSMAFVMVALPVRTDAQESFSASLIPLSGLVQYRPGGTEVWQNVVERQLVRAGDQIRTGGDGSATLSVVTGIEVDIYPTSVLEIGNLTMRETSGQIVSLIHVVGQIFVNVTRPVRAEDRVQVVLPTAGVVVKGTQFWTFMQADLHGAVVGQENNLTVSTGDGRVFDMTQDNLLYLLLNLPEPAPLVCSAELLGSARGTLVLIPVAGDPAREQSLRDFLRDFLSANVNPVVRGFLTEYLGLPAVDLNSLTAEQDVQALDALFSAIQSFDLTSFDLVDFLARYRTYWAVSYRNGLTNPLAPATCGNGVRDTSESVDNCPTDFTNAGFCGNGLCETDRRGIAESVVNCAADCFTNGQLALSCAVDMSTILGLPPVEGAGPGGRPRTATPTISGPTFTPSPTLPPPGVGTRTPTPSL